MPLHRLASLCLIVTASAQELSGPGALEAERSSAVPSASPSATTKRTSRAWGVGGMDALRGG